jgi:hypothetical protein
MISLPLYATSIQKASDLIKSIPSCTAVYRWAKEFGCWKPALFDAYFDISDPAEDFYILVGHAYWINVSEQVIWNPPVH